MPSGCAGKSPRRIKTEPDACRAQKIFGIFGNVGGKILQRIVLRVDGPHNRVHRPHGFVRGFGYLFQVRRQVRRAIRTLTRETGQHADLCQARPEFIVNVMRDADAFLF